MQPPGTFAGSAEALEEWVRVWMCLPESLQEGLPERQKNACPDVRGRRDALAA